jgi:hypothetical protein
MTTIQIHLDGKPVTKLQGARSVADVNGESVVIGVPNADGWIQDNITVYKAHRAYGGIQPPELGCMSFHASTPAEMRQQAQMITLAAEIAELAEMIAAESVAEFTSDSRLTPARCQAPAEHGPSVAGAIVDCDIAAHHQPEPAPEPVDALRPAREQKA